VTRRRGFTLVEVSTVVVVLVLVVSVLAPRLVAMQEGTAFRSALRAVERMPSWCQARAVQTKQTVVLRFDDAGRSFVVEREEEGGGSEQLRTVPLPDGFEAAAFESDGLDSTVLDWRVEFYSDGTANAGAVEFATGGEPWTLRIEDGRGTLAEGALGGAGPTDWEAGELERRVG
jgi:prepilin-type N-terminal cleavage/methylation domain-containing protein